MSSCAAVGRSARMSVASRMSNRMPLAYHNRTIRSVDRFPLPTGSSLPARGTQPISHKYFSISSRRYAASLLTVRQDGPVVALDDATNPTKTRILHKHWLRDQCTCSACVDPDSGQKSYSTADMPVQLKLESMNWAENGSLNLTWSEDFLTHGTHHTTLPRTTITRLLRNKEPQAPYPWKPWRKDAIQKLSPYLDYEAFMTSPSEGLKTLKTYGLIFLKGVPPTETAVQDIGGKIGLLQNTFYGLTWDVKSKPKAINVAYTNSYLGLHQDLLYMADTPRIQILHCLKNECEGGESLFRDGHQVWHDMLRSYPDDHGFLQRCELAYHYTGHKRLSKPVMTKDCVWWSPPFQDPTQRLVNTHTTARRYERMLRALRNLKETVERADGKFEYKMREGECAVFDNRRVLHGRNEFNTAAGERWLKGAYVNNDSFTVTMNQLWDRENPAKE